MSGNAVAVVMKSSSDGELLGPSEMTLNNSNNVQSVETSRLKRTFTLPRNPFNSTRMSRRRIKSGNNETDNKTNNNNNHNNSNEMDKNNKKIFRRPSFRKLINKIAQHIGGVPVINSGADNRVPPVGYQTWTPDQTPGVTGLKNHGNTCFINAVLQCIAHTDILAEYFVLDLYKVDLSRRNKLNSKKFGTKGEVTEQLALILKALWACQYTPELSTSFKQVVERHGSQYKGSQQHDAHEFFQWLLDKAHEDLKMASKKKFKTIKVSGGGKSDEIIAAETLANYNRGNNSFIQAVFQAQYRSSLSCSRCRTQSNTFDPFQCISVQLPQIDHQSIYVTVLYTSQQPRQVRIGLSLPSGATVIELRDILESDTSINKKNMLLTEIGSSGFMRTFTNSQPISVISEIDPVYCIEVAQLKDIEDDATSAYILLCWINVVVREDSCERFGSPYTMQISRETSYEDLQKLVLKEMASILHDDVLTSSQPCGIFKMKISDPACDDNEPPCYLEPELQHPLFMEAIDQALALCGEDEGPAHVKLVLEWTPETKTAIIADDCDYVEEHSSVRELKAQALQGGAPLTLEECLRHYTKAETLTMDDAWRCPHCQQYLPVVKTLDVWSLPDILVVHFKRFRQQTLKGCQSTKLTTMVDFPVFGFDMSPHLANKKNTTTISNDLPDSAHLIMHQNNSTWKRSPPQHRTAPPPSENDNTYDLYAVCYHHGSDLETGHYTAACRNPYDGHWYLYDDTKVTNLSQQTNDIGSVLVNSSAYILFYQKRSGVYVGSSSSSAASSSSVCSSGDHWVTRMPKFNYVPPKTIKVANNNNNINNKQTSVETKPKNCEVASQELIDVATEEISAEETLKDVKNDLEQKNGPVTLSINGMKEDIEIEEDVVEEVKGPVYTTSIFINSSGNVDIKATRTDRSPVLSLHRINGVAEERKGIIDGTVPREKKRICHSNEVFAVRPVWASTNSMHTVPSSQSQMSI
ncbi:ubiquitin carboxyl-terminal hydrolase 31 [Agrilus planipennis]|uniref:Ubiquitin carboxyl-terminal hydrolase n=1 Tax=Agrilus planipennis TaxID=224129 RepID=A0A7F5R341_AGRPL|nr:ubiquitin carboxyl-terminal hydrolase 31 [Agrilus planipennis]